MDVFLRADWFILKGRSSFRITQVASETTCLFKSECKITLHSPGKPEAEKIREVVAM